MQHFNHYQSHNIFCLYKQITQSYTENTSYTQTLIDICLKKTLNPTHSQTHTETHSPQSSTHRQQAGGTNGTAEARLEGVKQIKMRHK